jgi:hypothetical protein
MLNRDAAMNALRGISALTTDIDFFIQNWQGRSNNHLENLGLLQERNRHVFDLSRIVANPKNWNDTVKQAVLRFLIEEFEEQGLLKKKFGCLYALRSLNATWELTYSRLRAELVEIHEVALLWADLYAFDALESDAYAFYETIIEPVVQVYKNSLTITLIDTTDTIRAYLKPPADINHLLEFAKELRTRVIECRRSMALSEVISIGVGIAYGGLKFNLLTGKPLPDSSTSKAGTWYEAAKLMGKAERLCKHLNMEGGVILVSDEVGARLEGKFVRRNMREIDSSLDAKYDCEVNIYDGHEIKSHRQLDRGELDTIA